MMSIYVGFIAVFMALNTSEQCIITWCSVTLGTLVPFAPVLSTINGEILCIVIECRWGPGILRMTCLAIGREHIGLVVGISGLIVIGRMAAKASVWRIGVITIMAARTVAGNGGMSTLQGIIAIMLRELCRTPARFRRMASRTVGA